MRADLHVHTRYSPDSETPVERIVERCLRVGLTCVAITDHNTIEGALEAARLAPFAVIIGEEVRSADGEITGLFLREPVTGGLTAVETVRRIKEQGGLVSIPHPFDRFRGGAIAPRALAEVMPQVDVVEVFNARNVLSADDRKALALARRHPVLVSAVSDGHVAAELGRTYVEMPDFDGTPQGFKESLARGHLVMRRATPLVHVLTRITRAKRRLLGVGHRLG